MSCVFCHPNVFDESVCCDSDNPDCWGGYDCAPMQGDCKEEIDYCGECNNWCTDCILNFGAASCTPLAQCIAECAASPDCNRDREVCEGCKDNCMPEDKDPCEYSKGRADTCNAPCEFTAGIGRYNRAQWWDEVRNIFATVLSLRSFLRLTHALEMCRWTRRRLSSSPRTTAVLPTAVVAAKPSSRSHSLPSIINYMMSTSWKTWSSASKNGARSRPCSLNCARPTTRLALTCRLALRSLTTIHCFQTLAVHRALAAMYSWTW